MLVLGQNDHANGPAREDLPSLHICRWCGATQQPHGGCPTCAVNLVDLALSDFGDSQISSAEEVDSLANGLLRRYGHYEICFTEEGLPWELGRGAMGITYKAVDTRLNCAVALKVINTDGFDQARVRERFLQEARTTAGLRHPNIASVFHLGAAEEECFYVMELIEGETLESRVRSRGALSCTQALDLAAQAARALHAAHKRQLIHRDIKPTNLMLIEEGRGDAPPELTLKIIDFGLVKAVAEPERTSWKQLCQSYFAGTPFYASPEQLSGGMVDARSDIFSLGRCFWYMLAGASPLVLESSHGVSSQHHAVDIEPLPGVSVEVMELLRMMTAADPLDRPQDAALLLQYINGCQTALQRPTPPSVRRVGSVRSWLGLTIRMVVLSVLLLGGWLWLEQHPSSSAISRTVPPVEARLLFEQGEEFRHQVSREANEQAMQAFKKATKLCPAYAEAHAALAATYLQSVFRYGAPKSQIDNAIASARKAIALNPNSPAGYTVLGDIRTIQGMHWDALREYHHALENDPKFPAAMRGFSSLWSTVGMPQLGLPWGKAVSQIDSSHVNSWISAADASTDLCADQEALNCYRHCLEINPKLIAAHCGLMHIHLLEGNFFQAQQDSLMADAIDPTLIMPRTLKAQIALFRGEYAEAEKLYRQLIAMRRDGMIHYYSGISYLSALGFLCRKSGRLTEGNSYLEEAVTMLAKESEGPQAIYDLAAIRAVEGRIQDALSLLKQAVDSGWLDYRATRLDPRFEQLRGTAGFEDLLSKLSLRVDEMRARADELCAKPLALADYPVRPAN